MTMETDLIISGGAAAILITAAITYAFRFGGLMLADRLPQTGPVRRFLDALPGAILLSLVVPAAGHAGWAGAVGLSACLAVYMKSKNLLLTMGAGVLAVWLFRQVG
jgi:uncharacterized membrane protein